MCFTCILCVCTRDVVFHLQVWVHVHLLEESFSELWPGRSCRLLLFCRHIFLNDTLRLLLTHSKRHQTLTHSLNMDIKYKPTKYENKWRKWFYCWVWKFITHANSDVEACSINILLANQREVNKKKLKELNTLCFCTGPNILQYTEYYYTTGLQFMSLVQQSQRKLQVCYSSVVRSNFFFLRIRPTDRPLAHDDSGAADTSMLRCHSLFLSQSAESYTKTVIHILTTKLTTKRFFKVKLEGFSLSETKRNVKAWRPVSAAASRTPGETV